MKIGTPVIVSNIPPFKEVVQNTGLFIDPQNQDDLVEKMMAILKPEIRKKYSHLGQIQSDKFSWDNTAKSIISVFQKFV